MFYHRSRKLTLIWPLLTNLRYWIRDLKISEENWSWLPETSVVGSYPVSKQSLFLKAQEQFVRLQMHFLCSEIPLWHFLMQSEWLFEAFEQLQLESISFKSHDWLCETENKLSTSCWFIGEFVVELGFIVDGEVVGLLVLVTLKVICVWQELCWNLFQLHFEMSKDVILNLKNNFA